MSSIEKGCHWYFPPLNKGIEEKNTTDSDEETLKNQSGIDALVRESIQNSLDVHDDSGNPVIMKFSFGSIKKPQEQIPAFLEIQKYIQGSKDYICGEGYQEAAYVFDPMIDFLDKHKEAFPYLCVSDSNTVGMDHSRFKAFTTKGSSFKKGKGAGGSYGIGKAAYYMVSKIRTILVSSMYKDESNNLRRVFEGFSKLTTNEVDGKKHYDKGYYDFLEAEPIKEASLIPDGFERDAIGTSIYIMGIEDSEESLNKLFKDIFETVIRNFWLAIHVRKLKVIIDFENDSNYSIEIDSEKLKEIIPGYDKFDIKGAYTNPRPYYEAVTTAVKYNPDTENPAAVYFEYNHEEFGKAIFYLIKNDQKHDRFLKMRSPRMFVSLEKTGGKRGYNGLLVCDDKWNELLTHAEPPAHDAWEEKRISEKTKISQEDKLKATEALREINRFADRCIKQYFNEDRDNDIDFVGIKDLLYTEKNLDSDSNKDGNATSLENGIPTNQEGPFGIATSKSLGVEGEKELKMRPIASVTAVKKAKTLPDQDGSLRGKKRKKRKRKERNNKEHDQHKPGVKVSVIENPQGKEGQYREIFNVEARCFRPSGEDLYTMVINSPRKIEKAMVELSTGGAINTVVTPVVYSDSGVVDKHRICDIPLEAGINVLHFKFEDNISHSVTIATYEFK